MTEYDNNLRGVLFPTTEKRNENSPDYSGSCEIDGKQYWIDGWKRKSREGKPFLSMRLKAKEARREQPAAKPAAPPPPQAAFDDDIPF